MKNKNNSMDKYEKIVSYLKELYHQKEGIEKQLMSSILSKVDEIENDISSLSSEEDSNIILKTYEIALKDRYAKKPSFDSGSDPELDKKPTLPSRK